MYNITRYPDGQINIKIEKYLVDHLHFRINSYEDLFILKSITDCYKTNNIALPNLFIPCLFGQQSDRRFSNNESFDLKIIADFINSCNFPRVDIFDPHSDVACALINKSFKISPAHYINSAIKSIERDNKSVTLISPDAGAYKKVFKIASDNNKELIAANKFRDREGNITLNISGDVKGKSCLIADDICINGGTFIQLTKKLQDLGAHKVFLYVSHFKGGQNYFTTINNLASCIDHIYTTNSVREIESGFVTTYKICL